MFEQLWPGVEALLEALVVGPSPAATQVSCAGAVNGWVVIEGGWGGAATCTLAPVLNWVGSYCLLGRTAFCLPLAFAISPFLPCA